MYFMDIYVLHTQIGMTQNHTTGNQEQSMTLIPHSYEMHMTVFAVQAYIQ